MALNMRQVASGLAISHIVFMYAGHGSDASAYMKGLTYESFVVATIILCMALE